MQIIIHIKILSFYCVTLCYKIGKLKPTKFIFTFLSENSVR
jgi:hypothetical protein